MTTRVTEHFQIIPAAVPVDLAGAAGAVGPYVSLKNWGHVAVILIKAAGAAGEPPTITLQQAQAVAGTGVKALSVVTRVDVKSGADIATVGQFSKVTQAAASTYVPAAGNTQAVYVIEFDSDQLDINNGFDCFRASIADVGTTAQIAAMLYLLTDGRQRGQFPPSALSD